jgi:hypothetical protein
MSKLDLAAVQGYVSENIGSFHSRRLKSLQELKLDKVLKRKNPYLFKAKNVLQAQDLVKLLLDAHLSSQEEGIFGDFLEGLAIFVCHEVYGGAKSTAEGIDLELTKGRIRYVVSVKSGPNWGNSRQVAKMKEDFRKAKRVLRTSAGRATVEAINGCCYGRDDTPDKGDYQKLCGQRFWEFISGSSELYTDIIEPLGYKTKQRNEEFLEAYAGIINRFTQEFISKFCDDGAINWQRLVQFNSSSAGPKGNR